MLSVTIAIMGLTHELLVQARIAKAAAAQMPFFIDLKKKPNK